jgi:hypothetical protein
LAYNRAKLYSGKALDFDGVNDYIVDQTISIDTTSFSVSVYAKGDALGSNSSLLSFGDNSTFDLILYPYDSAASGVRIYDKQIPGTLLDGVIAELGVYNMFTMQCDGEFLELYINGQFVKKSARTYSSTYTRIQFGKVVTIAQYFDGQIANARLFNTALTAAQVADLYNNPEKVVPTGVDNTALKLWLPMMEGAGTTAYDGSGNGNHGTISGATYVNGVGAPVSQSAVMDWNKGTNILAYSEELNQSSKWFFSNSSVTANDTTAPDGSETADKVTYTATANGTINQQVDSLDTSSNYTTSVWIKGDANYTMKFGFYSPAQLADINITTEWQRFEYTATPSGATRYPQITNDAGGVKTIYVWGWQLEKVSSAEAYIPNHTNTAITTPVLLPQGLTTGRDITGVNLFENARKQGALNLDGNSWAEVHDNASLDITDAITLEAWVYLGGTLEDRGVLGRYVDTGYCYMLYIRSSTEVRFYTNSVRSTVSGVSSGWRHIVGVYDGSTRKVYVDGSLSVTDIYSTALNVSSDPVEIGRYLEDIGKAYDQPIAQPRIYNRALTASEVLQNYNSGKNTYK